MRAEPTQGLLDTNIMILREWIDASELPDEMAISAVTLAELTAGPMIVRSDSGQEAHAEHVERARRINVLQRTENEFDPIPFGVEAARIYGQLAGLTVALGRKPRSRTADLMIAATAAAEGLPLFTTNPSDFKGLDDVVTMVAVTRPVTPFD
ncbi:type II toxin-antitoxin system VapC family toxin [Myceligenerans sp. TRM 65318]|uniref:Type II toxin-antitoxin system VapC family toxin n=2 Tax=Myceligenerans pegani TaxID=2776917 RepID=A0ABR9MRX2_9MICO|nr:type II toxin-antitoxin system VapC family toxin [Myceligenerans sp. TRM 65318]MBE3016397.1 type II toxin-antitoxin system VapC family toxin [Myceligenerans sp. TRM 65318]